MRSRGEQKGRPSAALQCLRQAINNDCCSGSPSRRAPSNRGNGCAGRRPTSTRRILRVWRAPARRGPLDQPAHHGRFSCVCVPHDIRPMFRHQVPGPRVGPRPTPSSVSALGHARAPDRHQPPRVAARIADARRHLIGVRARGHTRDRRELSDRFRVAAHQASMIRAKVSRGACSGSTTTTRPRCLRARGRRECRRHCARCADPCR